jgi:hypothetical protein
MALTPFSSTVPYADPSDFAALFDYRVFGEVSRDDNGADSATSFLSDPNVLVALQVASGELESAALVSERYTPDDLKILNGNSLAYLKSIVCGLAAGILYRRRYLADPLDDPRFAGTVGAAKQAIIDLRSGMGIFAFEQSAQAGVPQNRYETEADFLRQNLITNNSRFFGNLQDRKRPLA